MGTNTGIHFPKDSYLSLEKNPMPSIGRIFSNMLERACRTTVITPNEIFL